MTAEELFKLKWKVIIDDFQLWLAGKTEKATLVKCITCGNEQALTKYQRETVAGLRCWRCYPSSYDEDILEPYDE